MNSPYIFDIIYTKLEKELSSIDNILDKKYFETIVYFLDSKFMFEINLLISEMLVNKSYDNINIVTILEEKDVIIQFIIFLVKRFKRKIINNEYK